MPSGTGAATESLGRPVVRDWIRCFHSELTPFPRRSLRRSATDPNVYRYSLPSCDIAYPVELIERSQGRRRRWRPREASIARGDGQAQERGLGWGIGIGRGFVGD